MGYQPPGSGLGGSYAKKVELSKKMKKPLRGDTSVSTKGKSALAIKKDFEANQTRLRAEYEAQHAKPTVMPQHRMTAEEIVRMVDREILGINDG